MAEADVEFEVQRVLTQLGPDLPHQVVPLAVTRLGGLTNRNFRIDSPEGSLVLRLPGEGTGDYIDRRAEAYNARVASAAGVNAEILYFNPDNGIMVTRWLEAQTMSCEAFQSLGAVERAGRALARLHAAPAFQGRFELFEQIDRYRTVLAGRSAVLPEGYTGALEQFVRVREALERHPVPLAPCHCDPLVENFLDSGESMSIIDFEYAGNNDPMWDLGDLAVEGEFSAIQEQVLLQAYFDSEPSHFDRGRMVLYKASCDLLWTLWGVVQHADGNPADDFWSYANRRLQRCLRLIQHPDFETHREAVDRGP